MYIVKVLTFCLLRSVDTTSSSSCLHYVAGGGGYLLVVSVNVHRFNPLIYAVARLKKKLSVAGCLACKYSIDSNYVAYSCTTSSTQVSRLRYAIRGI